MIRLKIGLWDDDGILDFPDLHPATPVTRTLIIVDDAPDANQWHYYVVDVERDGKVIPPPGYTLCSNNRVAWREAQGSFAFFLGDARVARIGMRRAITGVVNGVERPVRSPDGKWQGVGEPAYSIRLIAPSKMGVEEI
jgi:hypothetical protein